MQVKKFYDISFIKTMMMLLVVFFHCCVFFGNDWFTVVKPIYNANYLYKIACWLNTFHIYVFAMASGFLFYYKRMENNKEQNHFVSIIEKTKRLLFPYIFTGILWYIPLESCLCKKSIKEMFYRFVLGKSPAQLWFLIMLFIVTIIFEFIYDKVRISKINLFIILVMSSILFFICNYYHFDYYQINNVFRFIPFFYFGGYLYKNRDKYKVNINHMTMMMVLVGLILTVFSMLKNNTMIIVILKVCLLQLFSMIEVFLVYVIGKLLMDGKQIKSRLYKVLEQNSFGIYLFHQQIVYICIIFLNGFVHPLMQVILCFIISLIVSLCMSLLLSKNKITKIMFGL